MLVYRWVLGCWVVAVGMEILVSKIGCCCSVYSTKYRNFLRVSRHVVDDFVNVLEFFGNVFKIRKPLLKA